MALSHSYFNAVKGAAARCLTFPSLLRLNARTFAELCPARFCGQRAFTICPLLWTPRFYCLSTFLDTVLLLPVHFCGHRAFTICPLFWTPRFYHLSTFLDTTLLPSVHFCGHRDFTACPLLWTPRFLLSVRFCGHRAIYCLSTFVDTAPLLPVHFCGHFPYTTAQNSSILEFAMAYFCARITDFCRISLLSRSIYLSASNAKFHNTGIFNSAVF